MKALSGPPGGAEPNPAIIPGKRIGRSCRAIPGSERPLQRSQEPPGEPERRQRRGGGETRAHETLHEMKNNKTRKLEKSITIIKSEQKQSHSVRAAFAPLLRKTTGGARCRVGVGAAGVTSEPAVLIRVLRIDF